MIRKLVYSAFALLIVAGGLRAEEIKGKVKSTDSGKSTITVTVEDNKDMTFSVAKDAKIFQLAGKKLKKAVPQDVTGGLSGLETGKEVTITTSKQDGKDVATSIKVEGLAAKKKKKNK